MSLEVVYVASPMYGHDLKKVEDRQNMIKSALEDMGYRVHVPSIAEAFLARSMRTFGGRRWDDQPYGIGRASYRIDKAKILSSDILFADLTYAKRRSIGCVSELTICEMTGKMTVGVLPTGNCHEHPWVVEVFLGAIFEDLDRALGYMKRLRQRPRNTEEQDAEKD